MILLVVSGRIAALPIGIALALSTASVQAADVDAFLAGTSRNCVECNLSGRDLKARDFKRAKLDRASSGTPTSPARACSAPRWCVPILPAPRSRTPISTWSTPSGPTLAAPI
jgi:hypothetical protein